MRFVLLSILLSVAFGQSISAVTPLSALLARYQTEPRNALLCEQIGVEYARSNQFAQAAEFFRRSVNLDPGRISAEKNLAIVLWFSGNKAKSETIFRSLEKRIPNDRVPQLYLGLAAYERKEYGSAAGHFDRAGPLASDNPELFTTLVDTYLSARQFARVSKILEARVSSGDASAQEFRWLAEAYDGQQLPDKAYRSYADAIQRDPKSEENYLGLAEFAVEHGSPTFAEDVLQRGLRQLPHSPKLLLESGLVLSLAGKFEDGRNSILAANAADPHSATPLLALGVLGLQMGDAKGAAEYFRKAKDLAPRDSRCYYLHALALSRSPSSRDAAVRAEIIAELHRALKLDPSRPAAYVLLAETESSAGHSEAASENFRQALRLKPDEPTALYQYALLCRRQGKMAEAARLLQDFQRTKKKSQDEENGLVLVLRTLK